MGRFAILFVVVVLVLLALVPAAQASVVYNGTADMLDGVEDGLVWGSPTFAKDKLVVVVAGMNAWNHWNGMVAGGSGTVWHYGFTLIDNDWVVTSSQGVVKTEGLPPYHLWASR